MILNIPETVDFDDKEVRMAIAASLFEKGKLSPGQAAEVVRLSKREFMENLSSFGVSLFNYSPSDLDRDLKNAEVYNI